MGKLTNLNPPTPNPQYLPENPIQIEFRKSSSNFIDFHVDPSDESIDFDARCIVFNGQNQNGKATVSWQASLFQILGNLQLGTGASLARILSGTATVDLPSIAAGSRAHVEIAVAGSQVGDLAFFVPTVDLYNGLWCFNIQAVVITNGVVRVYFHNLFSTALDIAAFPARLLVIGF
jgi:hypothetical protein